MNIRQEYTIVIFDRNIREVYSTYQKIQLLHRNVL